MIKRNEAKKITRVKKRKRVMSYTRVYRVIENNCPFFFWVEHDILKVTYHLAYATSTNRG